jgi:uridylate kinase
LCRDNSIPIVVFSIREQGNILKVLDGSGTFTVVTQEKD